jgi:hypothetical protein
MMYEILGETLGFLVILFAVAVMPFLAYWASTWGDGE